MNSHEARALVIVGVPAAGVVLDLLFLRAIIKVIRRRRAARSES